MVALAGNGGEERWVGETAGGDSIYRVAEAVTKATFDKLFPPRKKRGKLLAFLGQLA